MSVHWEPSCFPPFAPKQASDPVIAWSYLALSKETVFNGKFRRPTLSRSLNNITHSATLGLKGHFTPLHSTKGRMVGSLLKVRNCFRKNKQTLDPIRGKRTSSSNLERLENLSSPLTLTLLICSLLFLPVCFGLSILPFLSLFLSLSLSLSQSHFFLLFVSLSVGKVIPPIHLPSIPPFGLSTHTHAHTHSVIWFCVYVPLAAISVSGVSPFDNSCWMQGALNMQQTCKYVSVTYSCIKWSRLFSFIVCGISYGK